MSARERNPTLADVARHAGVSLATASRALNGSARTVNAELEARVRASGAVLRYSANAQAQAVARGTSRTVAVVLGDIADPYFAAIAAGVIRVAEERGYVVTLAATGTDDDRERSTLGVLKGQRPQVLIMAGSRSSDGPADARTAAELAEFERIGGRVVFIGSAPAGFRCVTVRNAEGAAALACALVGIGYRDFTVLAGPTRLLTPSLRAQGFLRGLEHGSPDRADSSAPPAVCTGAFSRDGGYDVMRRLLKSGARPECVFAVTDVMAVGAIAAIRDAGLVPGRDIAVAGFDDIQMLQDITPSLTTVHFPLAEIGARALETALADVDPAVAETGATSGGATSGVASVSGEAVGVAIEGRVIVRDSTPPRHRSSTATPTVGRRD